MIFNALIIPILMIITLQNFGQTRSKCATWYNILKYTTGGVLSPFIGLIFFEMLL